MDPTSDTYEVLRSKIANLEPASDPTRRALIWATEPRVLGLARDQSERVEVFVLGEPLQAATQVVRDVLEFNVWRTDGGADVAATRLVLPHGVHFDQLAALLCVEMIGNGVTTDAQAAFAAVEPLAQLALVRERVPDLTLMGLIGELTLLKELLARVAPAAVPDILGGWAGSVPSARDFQFGPVGVEVKTAQSASSIHYVEGVHQVELGRSNEGVLETDLFMLSLGISWLNTDDEGSSLPELVDELLHHIPDQRDRLDLLARIKQYGGDGAIGYDHERDRLKSRHSARFYFRFERLYDMTDPRLRFLTSADLVDIKNIDPGSVTFRIVLLDRIRGEINPVTTWTALTAKILQAAGITDGAPKPPRAPSPRLTR